MGGAPPLMGLGLISLTAGSALIGSRDAQLGFDHLVDAYQRRQGEVEAEGFCGSGVGTQRHFAAGNGSTRLGG
jgi:hypothetical protein